MSAAFDFSALSPPFLRNLVDSHIFPPILEWTDSSLNRAEQLLAKNLAQVRDTLKDSEKQSSHVRIRPCILIFLTLNMFIGQCSGRGRIVAITSASGCSFPWWSKVRCHFFDVRFWLSEFLCSLCFAAVLIMMGLTKGRMRCGVFEDWKQKHPTWFECITKFQFQSLISFIATAARLPKFLRVCRRECPRWFHACDKSQQSNEDSRRSGKPFVCLVHLHFFAFGASKVERYMRGLRESKTLAKLLQIQSIDIINVLWSQ